MSIYAPCLQVYAANPFLTDPTQYNHVGYLDKVIISPPSFLLWAPQRLTLQPCDVAVFQHISPVLLMNILLLLDLPGDVFTQSEPNSQRSNVGFLWPGVSVVLCCDRQGGWCSVECVYGFVTHRRGAG